MSQSNSLSPGRKALQPLQQKLSAIVSLLQSQFVQPLIFALNKLTTLVGIDIERLFRTKSKKMQQVDEVAAMKKRWMNRELDSRITSVPRVEIHSTSQLMEYVANNRPVIITNFQTNCGPLMDAHNKEEGMSNRIGRNYIKESFGNHIVKISISQVRNLFYYYLYNNRYVNDAYYYFV
jgi:hypothetical protein